MNLKSMTLILQSLLFIYSAGAIAGNGGNEMMRDDIDQQEYFDRYGYDLEANVERSPTAQHRCLEMDESHMGERSFNDKYACMRGYEDRTPPNVTEPIKPSSPDAHPIFERRMQD